jgi:prefoldin subunit 5
MATPEQLIEAITKAVVAAVHTRIGEAFATLERRIDKLHKLHKAGANGRDSADALIADLDERLQRLERKGHEAP